MHEYVHGECVMLWVDASYSRRDVLGWLFMVTKYPLFQPNAFIRKS